MAEIKTLKYPLKSHRKRVTLPSHSPVLAEFFGIMIGDGGINNQWQANITLNSIKDLNYSKYIGKISNKLFDIKPKIRKRVGSNTLIVSIASTSVVDFLVKNGLVRGNKLKNGLEIPRWILNNKNYKKNCLRGLVDTDGCIFIHKHKINNKEYKNINLCFTSYSPKLISQVMDIFAEFKIIGHINSKVNSVYLYKEEDIIKYLKIFGTSNERIMSVYKEWRDARAV